MRVTNEGTLKKEVKRTENPNLVSDLKKGSRVFRYSGYISNNLPNGNVAVTLKEDTLPFLIISNKIIKWKKEKC